MRRLSQIVVALSLQSACWAALAQPAGSIDTARLLNAASEPGMWLTGGRDYQQSYFSPLTDINKENVTELGYAWHYETDTTSGLEATPIVVDGRMYTSGPRGAVYALDAATGQELWRFEPEIDDNFFRKVCCGIVNRGVAVWRGSVFVGSLDGWLIALDANDGEVTWKVDTLIDRERGYTITGAPYIAAGKVIIGNSGAELDARGYITAYDIATGEQSWRFYTVPGNPALEFEHPELEMAAATWSTDSLWEVGLGGTVWDAMAWDPELDLLYVGTGNATPYARKLRSPDGGDNLFLASILAINPHNGRLVWYYQTTPGENWDFTATQKIILADIDWRGEARKVLMQAPKNGFFYVLDRATGELLSAEPYAAVNWASHIDMQTGRPVETTQAEYFDEPKLIFPSPAGAHNWQPMSWNPLTELVYIPVIETGAIWLMPDAPFVYEKGALNMGSMYLFPVSGEYGLDSPAARALPPLEELSAGQPDTFIHGVLRAWSPQDERVVWEVDTSGPWAGDLMAFWNAGGVMSTASGLVFQGQATGEFLVLDAATGETLHSINAGASIMAAPMTYTIDGEQFVAVMAALGGGGGQSHPPESAAYRYGNEGRIVAFRLGGGTVPLRAEIDHSANEMTEPAVARRGTPEDIDQGAELFVRHCAQCHASLDGAGAGIPDLRFMNEQAHREFSNTVLNGRLADKGMGSFAELLSSEEVDNIHIYLIDAAWNNYEEQDGTPGFHEQD